MANAGGQRGAGARRRGLDIQLLRQLWPHVRPQRWGLFAALAITFPVTLFGLVQPALLKVVIDDYILVGATEGVAGVALLFLVALLLEHSLIFAQIFLLQWVGQRSMQVLQERAHSHALALDRSYHDGTPTGSLVTRLTTDIEALNEFFASGAVSIVTDALLLVGIVTTMLIAETQLALIALAFIPVLAVVSAVYGVLLRRAQRSVRRSLAKLNARLEEDVQGMEVVQLFNRQADRAASYRELNDAYFEANRSAIRWDSQLFAAVEGVAATAIALVLWYGAHGIADGVLAFGLLKMFMQYILRFFIPIRDMSAKFAIIQSAMAAAERVLGLLSRKGALPVPARAERLEELRESIRFENVSFAYDGEHKVLDDVSFTVRRGEKVALVGATGAGKSTVAKLLTRQYDPQGGRVAFDGIDLRDLDPADATRLVTIVPQDVFLFTASVRDNVTLGDPAIDDGRARGALRAVGAERIVERLEGGWDHVLTARGGALSTGEKQLFTYARALARDPDVLLLDEATSSVDSETEAAIERATEVLLRGRTAVVIAHRLSTIRAVDRILVFHKGQLRETGSHDELLAAGGLYARLHELQMRPIDYGNGGGAAAGAAAAPLE